MFSFLTGKSRRNKKAAKRSGGRADLGRVEKAEAIVFDGKPVRLIRSNQRKSISIQIKPQAPIQVRCPLITPTWHVMDFLNQKKDWINKHWQTPAAKTGIKADESYLFLGEPLKLKAVMTPLKTVFFSRHVDSLMVHLPEALWIEYREQDLTDFRSQFLKFYHREAVTLILDRMKIWQERTGLRPKKVAFRNQKTRWGSCSSSGTISLNWRLIAAPLEVIDYILVHELCHLQHMNHSSKFWSLVQSHYPNWDQAEIWLKKNGLKLDFLSDQYNDQNSASPNL